MLLGNFVVPKKKAPQERSPKTHKSPGLFLPNNQNWPPSTIYENTSRWGKCCVLVNSSPHSRIRHRGCLSACPQSQHLQKHPIFKSYESVKGDTSKAEVPTEVHVVRTRSLGATAMQTFPVRWPFLSVHNLHSKLLENWSKSKFLEMVLFC